MKTYDIIICGAGPAGSTCALALAGSGLKIAVIDKAAFPRDKVCGDAIAAYIPKVLHSIHPKYQEAMMAFLEKTEVDICRVVAPNEKHIDILSAEPGYIIPRRLWDNFLYGLAAAEPGIDWFLQQEITDVQVTKTEGCAWIRTDKESFQCKLLIGCDGAHSVTSKKLTGLQPDLQHYGGAVRAYYKNVGGIPAKTYELNFVQSLLPGYFWVFPVKENMANVGIYIPSHIVARKKINLRRTMEDLIQQHPAIKDRFTGAERVGKIEGYGLPLGSRKTVISGDHFMLCGDAASLIDPATGEGIGQAMISGRYAGWQAIRCFEKQDFSAAFLQQYNKQLYEKIWPVARNSYFLQRRIFPHRRIFNGLANLVLGVKPLRNFVLHRLLKVAKP